MPTYFGAVILGIPLLLFLFYSRPDLRHKMIYMGILITFVAPLDTFFIPTYWHPKILMSLFGLPIDIFTLLFGFELGSIASVLYEEWSKRTFVSDKKKRHPLKYIVLLGPISLFILKEFTQLNFMYDVLISTIIAIATIILVRPDLLYDVIYSGILFSVIYGSLLSLYLFLFPNVILAWNLYSFPQHFILNIPVYEILWGFVSGAFIGPLYEFTHDDVLRQLPQFTNSRTKKRDR